MKEPCDRHYKQFIFKSNLNISAEKLSFNGQSEGKKDCLKLQGRPSDFNLFSLDLRF